MPPTAGTARADRECEACNPTEFSSGTTNSVACQAITTCAAGEFVAREAGPDFDQTCSPCTVFGTYAERQQQDYGTGVGAGAEEASGSGGSAIGGADDSDGAGGTTTAAAAVAGADAGTGGGTDNGGSGLPVTWFSAAEDSRECAVHQHCNAGTRLVHEATPSSDRKCVACTVGFTTTHDAKECSVHPASRSIPPLRGLIRFRLAFHTYAPWHVRVVGERNQAKYPPRNISPHHVCG